MEPSLETWREKQKQKQKHTVRDWSYTGMSCAAEQGNYHLKMDEGRV